VPERFAHPALRVLSERFPRSEFPHGELATVERIHAEAEIERIEALRLRVRAAFIEPRPPAGAQKPVTPTEAVQLLQTSRELSAHSLTLFEEAGRAADAGIVARARPPFDSMRDWLSRLALIDPTVNAEVDRTHVIWMSLFVTLADHVDLSDVHRVLGVGVGFDGPEVHYNDYFAEHYCLDLFDYSDRNPNLKFITANIEEAVDLPAGSFDLVYSHSVFEHLRNVDRAMAQVDRLVKLGRYIYLTVCPLYYSPAGSHVNHPVRLEHWEHLDPASEYYLLDTPDPTRIHEGVFLNRLTVADFLAAVGRVGWEVRHFSLGIVHPAGVPAALTERFPMVDLIAEEFRFVGRKIIPKVKGLEW
jgi:SAM-dependent methyltransferase